MNKDGTHVVFRSSEDSGVWMLGVVGSDALKPLEKSEGCEQRIAFSPDGQYLVGIGWQAITLWDSETRRITRRLTWESLGQKTHSASTVALLRDNRTALVGCKPFSVLQIDLAGERVLGRFAPGTDENDFLASALAVSADEKIVAAACSHPFTPVVHAWEIQSGARAWEYSSRGFGLEGAYHLSFSGDGLNLAVANRGTVQLLDAQSGRLIESQVLGPPDQGKHGSPLVLGTSFSADGKYYATANGCGGAYLIRLR
jgi:WD40 repeat protein